MIRTSRLSWLALAVAVAAVAPALADDYLIYTDAGIPAFGPGTYGSDIWNWCASGDPCDMATIPECGTPEGSFQIRMRETGPWMGWGVFHAIDPGPDGARNPWCAGAGDPAPCCTGPGAGTCGGDDFATPVDLSAFLGGELRFFVKSPFELTIEMQCLVGGSTEGGSKLLSTTNWDGTDTWQEIVFPLSDFDFGAGPPIDLAECFGAVLAPFLATAPGPLPIALNEFRVDHVRWRQANSHPGASSVQVQGRQLLVNGEPFVVNGVAYSPISIGEDWRGTLRDRADRYLVDFPLIAASGANVVRIYSSFLTTAMLDAAWAEGLYVIPTFGVDATQGSCAEGRAFMRDRVGDMVLEWKDHPAILAWLIGNEVNVGLTNGELCAGWYPLLDSLAAEAHAAEGPSFHPVGTANADSAGLGEICQAGCSDDLTLTNLDFWGLQIYRGCSFGTAFTEYQKPNCDRPMIITEFGADSWDSLSGPSGAENETMQADCLATLLDEADQALAVRNPGGVSAGQVLFEWADEWWKAFALDPPVPGFCSAGDNTQWTTHDTCKGWEAFGYPDPAMNEEWWGITSLSSSDPNARGLRAAHGVLNASYQLGAVGDLQVVTHDPVSGNTDLTFNPAAGSTDHTLYYGPLSAVSTYGYTGSVSGLGATGSGSAVLPVGDLFWLVVGRNAGAEGCYGKDSACSERPPSPGSAVPPAANRTCSVAQCP